MKPIGSEKIENVDDKLARILEIAGIKKEVINENKFYCATNKNIYVYTF